MCGGFYCTRRALIALNIVYMMVGSLLIGVAAFGRYSSVITSVPVLGGVTFCGVFLLLLACLGLTATQQHHQVLLFFYMSLLLLLFVVQFAVACACLTVSNDHQMALAETGWRLADNNTRRDAQVDFGCCGFVTANNSAESRAHMKHPACPASCCEAGDDVAQCCMSDNASCSCQPCRKLLQESISDAARTGGGVGMFFSFTELIGFVLTYRYRNLFNPDRNTLLIN